MTSHNACALRAKRSSETLARRGCGIPRPRGGPPDGAGSPRLVIGGLWRPARAWVRRGPQQLPRRSLRRVALLRL